GRMPETINVLPAAPCGGGRGGPEGGAGRGGAPGAADAGRGAGGRGAGAPPADGAPGGGRGVGGLPGAGTPGSSFNRPSDVAWDKAGNIYVADGTATTNRVAKFDKDGRFLKQWGSTGSGNGQFNGVKSLAIDA